MSWVEIPPKTFNIFHKNICFEIIWICIGKGTARMWSGFNTLECFFIILLCFKYFKYFDDTQNLSLTGGLRVEVSTGPKFPARPANLFYCPARPAINILQNLYNGLKICFCLGGGQNSLKFCLVRV